MCLAGAPYLFDGRHLDVLIVVQRCIGGAHVIAKASYRHLITVVQRHGYCYASQGGDVLRGEKAGMEVISRLPSYNQKFPLIVSAHGGTAATKQKIRNVVFGYIQPASLQG